MYRFLLSRQWVILTLVALLLIPTMVWLGFWQLHRHEQRVERNDLIAGSLDSPKVPMAELTEVGGEPDPDDRYRPVTATGEYLVEGQVLARQRANDAGSVGYYVLTPLIQRDGTGVLVNRGWVPAGNDPTRAPAVAAPPAGEVTVTGRLMVDETSDSTGIRDRSGLPEGMVMLINAAAVGAELDTPMLGGYLELTDTEPAAGRAGGAGGAGGDEGSQPEPLPEPDHTSIGAHFAYAIQWWLFAAGVPVGWVLLVRRELHDRRTRRETGGAAAGDTTGAAPESGSETTAATAAEAASEPDAKTDGEPDAEPASGPATARL